MTTKYTVNYTYQILFYIELVIPSQGAVNTISRGGRGRGKQRNWGRTRTRTRGQGGSGCSTGSSQSSR